MANKTAICKHCGKKISYNLSAGKPTGTYNNSEKCPARKGGPKTFPWEQHEWKYID